MGAAARTSGGSASGSAWGQVTTTCSVELRRPRTERASRSCRSVTTPGL